MASTVGLVANVFNEINALPGWLETHLPFFDDIRVLHAGPQGEYSTDGTIELLEKWRVPVEFTSIDEGFGVVRTKALRMSRCDYIMLLDTDERFYHTHRVLVCEGESTSRDEADNILRGYDFRDMKKSPPNWDNLLRLGSALKVEFAEPFSAGNHLRSILDTKPDAVLTTRRHWHDFSFKKPTQNWNTDPDWQMRLVRNNLGIYFSPDVRMHERLVGTSNIFHGDTTYGPFFDHFHFTFKRMEQDQRAHDIAVYDSIHAGNKPPTLEQFRSGK